jgi:hypothetical protein
MAVTARPASFTIYANDFSSFLLLFIVMMEAIYSFETLVLTRATRRHFPGDWILKVRECCNSL